MFKKFRAIVKKFIVFIFEKCGFGNVSRDGIVTTVYNYLIPNVGNNNVLNREIWLEKILKKIPSGKSILDAGAGELQYKKFCNHLKYTSQDFGKYDGYGIAEGYQVGNWDNSKLDIVSDITSIPVPSKSFDAILCIEVFEHISDPISAIKEFSRIIKDGGKVIITAPFCSLTHFAPYYFANGYSKYWYEKILTENGFKIEEISSNGNFFEYLAQEIKNIKKVAYRYSKTDTRWWIFFSIAEIIILRALFNISSKDRGSSELLCFGLHVVAIKTK